MKRYFVFVSIFVLSTLVGLSQIKKGTVTIAGATSFNYNNLQSKYDDDFEMETSTIRILPSVSYFIDENFSLELGIGYSTVLFESDNNDFLEVFFSPRKYINITDNFYILYGGTISYGSGDYIPEPDERSSNGFITEQTVFYVELNSGLTYFLSKKFAIEAVLGILRYYHSNYDFFNFSGFRTENYTSNRLNLNIELRSVQLGLRYFF